MSKGIAPTTPMSSSRVARTRSRRTARRPGWRALLRRLRRWGKRAQWAQRKLKAASSTVRIVVVVAAILAVFAAANFIYQVVRKPTEMFFPVRGALNKHPAKTWQHYAPLFREYSTAAIPPELLAALAQIEGAGNPMATTYWRWRPSWNPFAIYQPASSAVGTYQMTDAAFAEARRYCIHEHIVVADGCWFNGLYMRVVPSHAVELTAIFLDRNVAAILAQLPNPTANPQQKQELAAIIHLCGATSGKAFARRGFRPVAGARCGDHDVATYLAAVNAMKREFRRFAADG